MVKHQLNLSECSICHMLVVACLNSNYAYLILNGFKTLAYTSGHFNFKMMEASR